MVIAELTAQIDLLQEDNQRLRGDLTTERIAGHRARQAEADTAGALEKMLRRNSELEGLAENLQGLRHALWTFLGVDGLAPPERAAPEAPVDLDTLAEKVAAMLGTGRPVVHLVPLEALKHRFQQDAVDRLILQVQALEERPRQAILWLLAANRSAKHMEICRRLAFPEAGASFAKFGTGIKEAVKVGVLSLDTDGLRVTIREKVAAELAPYGPSAEDIESTYQHLLAALAQGVQERAV